MRVLVTGKNGQIAKCLRDRTPNHPSIELIFVARSQTNVAMDLANEASIRTAVNLIKPDAIISLAAYTAVDQAEDEPELAMQVNGIAPGILAQEATKLGIPILHISTDYVFDGTLHRPYRPEDEVNPINIYGKTKLAGEIAVREANKAHIIIRTAWIYSPYGKNFYTTMLQLAKTNDTLSVVDDQIGNPTSAYEVADELFDILIKLKAGDTSALGTIRHLVCAKTMSWCEFARTIFAENNINCTVNAITTDQYPTKAKRPKNSRLL